MTPVMVESPFIVFIVKCLLTLRGGVDLVSHQSVCKIIGKKKLNKPLFWPYFNSYCNLLELNCHKFIHSDTTQIGNNVDNSTVSDEWSVQVRWKILFQAVSKANETVFHPSSPTLPPPPSSPFSLPLRWCVIHHHTNPRGELGPHNTTTHMYGRVRVWIDGVRGVDTITSRWWLI